MRLMFVHFQPSLRQDEWLSYPDPDATDETLSPISKLCNGPRA